jgi:DNA (cytosine-5)-methyltransferase 1
LNGLGYSVDAFIMDAAWFVPQSRKRLFVVGVQGPGDYANPLVNAIRPRSLVEFIIHHPDIAWNIRSMRLPSGAVDSLEQVLEELPEDSSEWWGPERSLYLLNQMSDRHRTIADQMIAGEAWRYGTVFRRTRSGFSTAELRTDGRAGCLRTPKGGSAKQIVIKAGFGECHVRHLTPRECARLMAADDYLITVPRDQALFGFGDAVCVSAVEWITKHYLNPVLAEIVK